MDVDCGAESTATLIALTGEIDASNSGWLTAQLTAVIAGATTVRTGAAPSSGVVIDLTRVRFCDATGVTALVKAFKRAQDEHLVLELAGATGRVDRILRLTGIDDVLTLHPEPADALRALSTRT
ncbi:STAS domain-containing protein [Actinomadura sp. 1N219]|uniref:STAS domain-containing protein n=1 Tax=Actinomadura sp. 1N219 TaxID=3375152 RepID=UPI0037BC2F34